MTTPPTTPTNLRSLAPWFTAVVLHSCAVTLYTVSIFDFADKQLAASASTRLWISAIWGFCYIFIALAGGKLTDRWGARKTLLLMFPLCILTELASLLIFLAPPTSPYTPWLLVALMLPVNITSCTCWPALETAVSHSPAPMPLSTRMAVYNISWAIPSFAAIFIRGALENIAWPLIFIAPALLTLIATLFLYKFAIPASMMGKHQVPDESAAETELNTPQLRQRAKTLLHMAWIGNSLSYVAINVLIPVLMLLASAAWSTHYHADVSLTLAGFVTSAWGFTKILGFLLTMKWTGWHYKARWLIAAQLALTLSFLIMLTVHDPLTFILAQLLFGLATAFIYSSSLYYAMHTSAGAGEHAGIHEALIGVGICIGPAIGALAGAGAALDLPAQLHALHHIAYTLTALLLLGTLAMTLMAMRRAKS